MSTPVVASTWAGTFDCGTCRRKRLMGEEFSKKALERHRRDGAPLKCKKCVAATEEAERDAAAARRNNQPASKDGNSSAAAAAAADDDEPRTCAGKCAKVLPKSAFNRNQWSKGDGKSRCRACVEQAVKDESAQQTKSKEDKIAAARTKVEQANATGNAQKMVAAESELAALEAEKVTGLKPVKLGRGRGRGGGGRGRGRGGRR
jgi:hypothetical protein